MACRCRNYNILVAYYGYGILKHKISIVKIENKVHTFVLDIISNVGIHSIHKASLDVSKDFEDIAVLKEAQNFTCLMDMDDNNDSYDASVKGISIIYDGKDNVFITMDFYIKDFLDVCFMKLVIVKAVAEEIYGEALDVH